MRILWRYLGKGLASLTIYGLTMVFALFFLEQSRYGTGDPITLMLLMLLLNLTARAMEPGPKPGWWTASFFVCGILGAVKYPQLVFALIPVAGFLSRPGCKKGRKLLLFALVVIGGFFLFSPKALEDPAYILRVIAREGGAYTSTIHENGGVANHILTLAVYLLLYSDFPLLPLAVLAGLGLRLFRRFRGRHTVSPEDAGFLFEVAVPGVCLFFFAYNLFVPVLFFRTLTPFFGILSLYTAVAAEALFARSKWGRALILVLTGCMILRGAGFAGVMAQDENAEKRLGAMISEAVDENWTETWRTCLFSFSVSGDSGTEVHSDDQLEFLLAYNGGMEIQPGQLIITGAQEFYLGQEYLLPVEGDPQHPVDLWAAFQEANQAYFVGQLYPDYYYYLFGGWLRGGTLSQYEFPCHYIYYRSR